MSFKVNCKALSKRLVYGACVIVYSIFMDSIHKTVIIGIKKAKVKMHFYSTYSVLVTKGILNKVLSFSSKYFCQFKFGQNETWLSIQSCHELLIKLICGVDLVCCSTHVMRPPFFLPFLLLLFHRSIRASLVIFI